MSRGRVLVTGSSGHVGGAVTRHLVAAGYEVVGTSRRPDGIDGASWVGADLAGQDWAVAFAGVPPCEFVVHVAASLAKGDLDSTVVATNCEGTRRVVALAATWSCRAFVYISGVPVIGMPSVLPITEDHPTCPRTAYHASKLFGEDLVRVAAAGTFAAATLRLTAPVGPGMPAGRILSHFVGAAIDGQPLVLAGRGSRRQDYVDVRDVASAVEQALLRRSDGLFNIGRGATVSNLELAEQCVRVVGSNSPIEYSGSDDPEEAIEWRVSIEKAAECIGYAPIHNIESSIAAVAAEHGAR